MCWGLELRWACTSAAALGGDGQPGLILHASQFLVLGSDGLWDFLTPAQVAQLIADTVKHPAMAAQRLTTEALTRGSGECMLLLCAHCELAATDSSSYAGDNVTALVVFLQPVETLERVYQEAEL